MYTFIMAPTLFSRLVPHQDKHDQFILILERSKILHRVMHFLETPCDGSLYLGVEGATVQATALERQYTQKNVACIALYVTMEVCHVTTTLQFAQPQSCGWYQWL